VNEEAELEGSELQEDVAFFIAKNLRSNVRELEGALRKVPRSPRSTRARSPWNWRAKR